MSVSGASQVCGSGKLQSTPVVVPDGKRCAVRGQYGGRVSRVDSISISMA